MADIPKLITPQSTFRGHEEKDISIRLELLRDIRIENAASYFSCCSLAKGEYHMPGVVSARKRKIILCCHIDVPPKLGALFVLRHVFIAAFVVRTRSSIYISHMYNILQMLSKTSMSLKYLCHPEGQSFLLPIRQLLKQKTNGLNSAAISQYVVST